jgi:hypothetical protein
MDKDGWFPVGHWQKRDSVGARYVWRAVMRQVEVRLKGWKMADAMGDLRTWLDRYNCRPTNFEIRRAASGGLLVRIEFADDRHAQRFEQDFRW